MAEKDIHNTETHKNYTYFDTLTLRPDLPEIVKSVQKPKGAFIKDGLPTWNFRPIDNKLPLLPGPDGPVVFSRGKLGSNLWRSNKETDFMLYDPYGYEVHFAYEPVHDKHLKKWFQNSKTREQLLKLGLVTKGMDVKCSVKDYNNYRKYLQRVHSNAVSKEVLKKEDINQETLDYNRANEILQLEMRKLIKKAENSSKRKENLEKLNLEAETKKQNCNRRLKRITETIAYMEQKKKTDLEKKVERSRAKNEIFQNKIKAGLKLERQRKIQTLRRWRDIDLEKKIKKNEEYLYRQEEAAKKAKGRWERKVENQQIQIQKEEYLHNTRKLQMKVEEKLWIKKMQTDWACLQEKILLQQGQPVLKHVTGRYKKKQKNILNTIKDKWYNQVAKGYSQDPNTLGILKEKIKNTLADIRTDLEPYLFIADAKRRLNKVLDEPEEVTIVVKCMIETAIAIAVAKKLENILYKITQRILHVVDRIKSSGIEDIKKNKSIPTKTSKISIPGGHLTSQVADKTKSSVLEDIKPKATVGVSKSSSSYLASQDTKEMKSMRVSFGDMKSVQRYQEDMDLKSSRNRPPTPVPSVITMTEAALQDPDIEVSFLPGEVFLEQKKLMDSIDEVGAWLLKQVDRRVKKQALTVKKSITKRWIKTETQSTNHPEPLIRLCNFILFSTKDDFLHILDTIITDVFEEIKFFK